MTVDEEEHVDQCTDHDDGKGCATDWSGITDGDSQLLFRTLYRPGGAPVVQLSLKAADGELVADFNPTAVRFADLEEFGRGLLGEFNSAAEEAEEFEKQRPRGA